MAQETALSILLASMGVTIAAKHVGLRSRNPDGTRSEWPHDEWHVTITYEGRTWSGPFKQGIGHRKVPAWVKRELNGACSVRYRMYRDLTAVAEAALSKPVAPTAADVVYCLGSDARCGESTFDEFCLDMGLDTDSRKAFDTYQACMKTRGDMVRLFGARLAEVYEAEH